MIDPRSLPSIQIPTSNIVFSPARCTERFGSGTTFPSSKNDCIVFLANRKSSSFSEIERPNRIGGRLLCSSLFSQISTPSAYQTLCISDFFNSRFCSVNVSASPLILQIIKPQILFSLETFFLSGPSNSVCRGRFISTKNGSEKVSTASHLKNASSCSVW